MSDTVLESKVTNYDAFNSLKASIQNESARHIVEGAAIIGSPSVAFTKGIILNPNDINDSRYKLHLATIVRDIILNHSTNSTSQNNVVEELLTSSIILSNIPYKKGELSLPLMEI